MFKYLVSGFYMFNFILTAEELKHVLEGVHAVIHNAHVPVGYVESSVNDYIFVYEKLYGHLAHGEKLVWKEHYRLFEGTGLTTNLGLCKYDRIHEYVGKMFYHPDFDEPCVDFSPMTLFNMRDKNGSLMVSTRVSYCQYPENTVGIVMSYPKKIQYSMGEDYEPLRSTQDLSSYQDYLLLKERISRQTKPLKFVLEGKSIRPNVRISKAALEDIRNFYYFKSNQCEWN